MMLDDEIVDRPSLQGLTGFEANILLKGPARRLEYASTLWLANLQSPGISKGRGVGSIIFSYDT